jgi:N6-L-threonylcarbamoyladenine synthase
MCNILALESSCDDTSAAVLKGGKILTNIVSSQEIHTRYGGVVPEYASRAHQKNIVAVVEAALSGSNTEKRELDAVAYTRGPGLAGSLLVADAFAKGMSLALDIPIIGVDHLHAHMMANFIDDPKPSFPFLCLLVSGGHTLILEVPDPFHVVVLGRTLDDAAGEAFDKGAKILGLSYPGGPEIDKMARKGNADAFLFPKPAIKNHDYSFSGLKTSLLYFVRDHLAKDPDFVQRNMEDICASYQHRIVTYLLDTLERAVLEKGYSDVALAGGVAANSYLRSKLYAMAEERKWKIFVPAIQYCTDNAAMIAITAAFMFEKGRFDPPDTGIYARSPV